MKLDTILVPLDGSDLAKAALGPAVDLLRTQPAGTLLLVRAAEAHTFPGADPTESQVRVVQDAEDYLNAVAIELRARGVERVKTSVWYGAPASSIVQAAEARTVDLIVMTTHGRSGLGRVVFGSVAESVLRGTRTPILLVRAPEAPIAQPPGGSDARPASPPR